MNHTLIKFKDFLLVTALVLVTSFKVTDPILLVDEAMPFKPNSYYIANVVDERVNKGAVAQVIVKSAENKLIAQFIDVQGGIEQTVTRFIERNLFKNKSLRPVTITIKQFNVIETSMPKGNIEGRIKLHLSFGLEKDYGIEQLIDYDGGLSYTRNGNNYASVVEPCIRKALKSGLVYFNDWVKNNTEANHKLAKGIKFSFTNYTEPTEGDTIYYSSSRPITWADFQSSYKYVKTASASVMPGFGYEIYQEVVSGIINVNVQLKVYLPKSACWADSYGRDAYALNHEQRHFDIAKIIAEQYKQKILTNNLTPDNYEAFILMQYLDSYRDMDKMQKAYDKETSHSRNSTAQQEWNERIDNELKKYSVIP
ncbi:MAG: hypothetical protein EOP47_02250 [Sphingobacteriaceae bacterium]|nr:MAG: hypothetical protein EOP47_02250 [Sphingobacteriaceae bacterium]